MNYVLNTHDFKKIMMTLFLRFFELLQYYRYVRFTYYIIKLDDKNGSFCTWNSSWVACESLLHMHIHVLFRHVNLSWI